VSTMRKHSPTPQVCRLKPSSAAPSQSLSMPSQTSGCGPLTAMHFYEKAPGSAPESFRTERIVAGDAATAAQEEALS